MKGYTGRGAALTVGIDARAATEVPAGRGRVVRELLSELARDPRGHRYLRYARTRWDPPAAGSAQDPNQEWRLIPAPDPLWHVRAAAAAARECDVFLSTNSYLTAALLRIPSVAIVYDLVTFDRSLQPNWRSMVIERLTLGVAVRRARELVCISQTTADALCARFPAAAPKASVALLGVSPSLAAGTAGAATPGAGTRGAGTRGAGTRGAGDPGSCRVPPGGLPPEGFILAVGTLEPRKNLPRLVAAYAALPTAVRAEHPLAVVGARGWQTGETLRALRSLGESCLLLGHVSDAELAELYRRCAAFCYPSLGEGFGLPVLEAMAAGAPVVTSSVSSLPEVGGDAVEYVDPFSVESISAGLRRVLEAPARCDELRRLGPARARQFSWGESTDLIVAALERAAR
jgi:glycosyltransferase involved in cell wall biosynthesis